MRNRQLLVSKISGSVEELDASGTADAVDEHLGEHLRLQPVEPEALGHRAPCHSQTSPAAAAAAAAAAAVENLSEEVNQRDEVIEVGFAMGIPAVPDRRRRRIRRRSRLSDVGVCSVWVDGLLGMPVVSEGAPGAVETLARHLVRRPLSIWPV